MAGDYDIRLGSFRDRGFTLVEVLVVIAVIAILASLLLPVLGSSKEKARRSACLNNVRQFVLAAHLYANDHEQYLPTAMTDNYVTKDTHTPILSTTMKETFFRYSSGINVLDCPNLAQSFNKNKDWRFHPDYGVAIGYHYLGGHENTPWPLIGKAQREWESPQKTTASPDQVLVADLNVYCHSYRRILTPHGPRGPVVWEDQYFQAHPEAFQQTPGDAGAQGGNVGRMDGSVAWTSINEMQIHRASQIWGVDGAFGLWPGTGEERRRQR